MYLDRMKLTGRVAVVTGGGQGIGLACVEALCEAGAHVIIADRNARVADDGRAKMKGKGYAVDVVYDRVLEKGERDFLVDLGGNLRVHGESAPGRGGWRTGVRNPFDLSEIVGMILLTNGESVATSGNYERFVKMDGRHYAHIMDTRTGHPAEGVAGVTVLAPSGVQCDGLSATLFILGPEAGQKFLTRFRPECEALWIPDSQPLRMFASPGFARRFHPLPEYQDAVTVLKP